MRASQTCRALSKVLACGAAKPGCRLSMYILLGSPQGPACRLRRQQSILLLLLMCMHRSTCTGMNRCRASTAQNYIIHIWMYIRGCSSPSNDPFSPSFQMDIPIKSHQQISGGSVVQSPSLRKLSAETKGCRPFTDPSRQHSGWTCESHQRTLWWNSDPHPGMKLFNTLCRLEAETQGCRPLAAGHTGPKNPTSAS